jgi:CubicO group peptidase (beta-lactamase class C family)
MLLVEDGLVALDDPIAPEFLSEPTFEPLGMADTGFHVPAD